MTAREYYRGANPFAQYHDQHLQRNKRTRIDQGWLKAITIAGLLGRARQACRDPNHAGEK